MASRAVTEVVLAASVALCYNPVASPQNPLISSNATKSLATVYETMLWTDFTLHDFDPRKNSMRSLTIPKKIHHVWHSWTPGAQPPQQYIEWERKLKSLHPSWEFTRWGNKNSRKLIEDHYPSFLSTYDSYDKPVKRSDAIRYFILHRHGGLYMDMSFLPLENVEDLLKGFEFVCAVENPGNHQINMAFMASMKEHPLLEKIVNGSLQKQAKRHVLRATGPLFISNEVNHFLTDENMKSKSSREKFGILPRKFVYPFGWWDGEDLSVAASECLADASKCKGTYPDAYVVKEWVASWALF
ncbi:hypothetical protein AAMO2058_001654000 [Amorphochlora amoebiformis]